MNEFNLIERYFNDRKSPRDDTLLGIGDDGAVTRLQADHDLVTVTDTMVNGVHFDASTPPRALGHKIVAVNLSDLAAMGAQPCWISLALTLPDADQQWLDEFAAGLHEICHYYDCALIGGDTTRGPLTLTVTAQGQVPEGQALTRRGAKPGDWVYVSGPLGDAGLALDITQDKFPANTPHLQQLIDRLHFPTPQVALGQTLRGVASACIDVSDGLLADLQHIVSESQVSAELELEKLPLSMALTEALDQPEAYRKALTAGDDYELCFTVPEESRGRLETLTAHMHSKPVCIGRIGSSKKASIELHYEGEPYELDADNLGYNHFATSAEEGENQ